MKRLLTFVLLLAVLFVGVGFYKGWFGMSAQAGEISFTYNVDKLKGDFSKATAKAKALGKAAVAKVRGVGKDVDGGQKEIEGRVTAVDAAQKSITIETGGDSIELPYLAEIDGLAELEGDVVTVRVETTADGVVLRGIERKQEK